VTIQDKHLCMDAYLAILQLDFTKKSSYTSKDIKRAFKKQALKWHPDRNIKNAERANSKMKNINEAHAYLIKVFENKQVLLDIDQPKPKTKTKSNLAKAEPFISPNFKQTKYKKEQAEQVYQDQIKKQQAKQDKLKKEKNTREQQAQKTKEHQMCLDKDALFYNECHYWKNKIASVTNPNEIDFFLTAKLVYVDLFRCEIENLPNTVTISSNIIEKIAQIWYQYPVSNGNTKYVQNFCNHHIAQCIHGAPESAFYSKNVIRQYLQDRAQTVAVSNQAITTMGRQELCIILYLIQNIIW